MLGEIVLTDLSKKLRAQQGDSVARFDGLDGVNA